MTFAIIQGLILPCLGTTLGAACVFFMKDRLHPALQRALLGFAAGVMTAATVWSLLLPALEHAAHWGVFAILPALGGVWLGIGFLILLDYLIPLNPTSEKKMIFAVALHNLPEGMAVGVVLAGLAQGDAGITPATVTALALGIALQNFPEGAIVSLPLGSGGTPKGRAFWWGTLSGLVEPAGCGLMLAAAPLLAPILPWSLGFAAGAMLFVVVEELIPQGSEGDSHGGTVFFGVGFSVMMLLDVLLG